MSIEDIFKVDDRRTTGVWLQDSERPTVSACDAFAVTNYLDRDVRSLGHLDQALTLHSHYLGTAHNTMQCCLIDNGPQPRRAIPVGRQVVVSLKYLLPSHPQSDRTLYFLF